MMGKEKVTAPEGHERHPEAGSLWKVLREGTMCSGFRFNRVILAAGL